MVTLMCGHRYHKDCATRCAPCMQLVEKMMEAKAKVATGAMRAGLTIALKNSAGLPAAAAVAGGGEGGGGGGGGGNGNGGGGSGGNRGGDGDEGPPSSDTEGESSCSEGEGECSGSEDEATHEAVLPSVELQHDVNTDTVSLSVSDPGAEAEHEVGSADGGEANADEADASDKSGQPVHMLQQALASVLARTAKVAHLAPSGQRKIRCFHTKDDQKFAAGGRSLRKCSHCRSSGHTRTRKGAVMCPVLLKAQSAPSQPATRELCPDGPVSQ